MKFPIAHRGLWNLEIPENSLASFECAILRDYPIELDIRLTDDDTLVVFHDETLKRMTQSDGYISNVKASELKNYSLLGTSQTIPTLCETLELIAGRTPVLIELKNFDKVGIMESRLGEILNNYKGDFAIQSFNPHSLEYFATRYPGFLRGLLGMNFTKEEQPSLIKRYMLTRLKYNHLAKPDFIGWRAGDLPSKFVTRANLPVIAYTVRSNAELERVLPHCNNVVFEKFIPQITKEFGTLI